MTGKSKVLPRFSPSKGTQPFRPTKAGIHISLAPA